MSRRRLALVLAIVIGASAAVPVIALAWHGGGGHSHSKLLIGFELHFTGPDSTAGTFLASGGVDDSGTSTVEGITLVPFGHRDRARLSGTQTFARAQGTIVTEFKGVAGDVSQPHQYGKGRFRIVSGTGDYAGLRGHGRFTIVVDQTSGRLIGTEQGRTR